MDSDISTHQTDVQSDDSLHLAWRTLKFKPHLNEEIEILLPGSSSSEGEGPPIHRETRVDAEGTKWSIEVLPQRETREDCQKRIKASWDELHKKVGKGSVIYSLSKVLESAKFIPPWMTPEFLYRINYGPITEKDREKVRKFLLDQ